MLLWLLGCGCIVTVERMIGALGEPSPGHVRLVVPRRDIEPGDVLAQSDLKDVELPTDYVPDAVVGDPGLLVGRTATARLLRHELVRGERLGPAPADAEPAFGPRTRGEVPQTGADTVMVIVSARDLPPGRGITEQDLYAVQIEPRFLPEGVFLSPEMVGRTPCEPILPNELIRAERLVDPATGQCAARAE